MANRTALFSRIQPGGAYVFTEATQYSGDIWFVDSGAAGAGTSDSYGRTPDVPFSTIAAAISAASANNGDVIYVLPGHAETITAVITVSKAGLAIIGRGEGTDRPQITLNGNVDGLSITGANVLVDNILFNEATAAHAATGLINVAAADVILRRIELNQGASDLLGITVTADGERLTLDQCQVLVTANGPDSFIKFEGVVDRPVIKGGLFVCSDGTNAHDFGLIDFDSVAVTNPVVAGNVFLGGGAAATIIANNGGVVGEMTGPNFYAGSAVNGDNVAAGELADALYGTGGIASFPSAAVPANSVSLAEVIRSVWAALEGTAAGENGITTWPAAAAPANTVSIAEAIRYIVETLIGTLVNTGGTATLGGMLGDPANTSIVTRLANILAAVQNPAAPAWGACDAAMGASAVTVVSDDLAGYGNDFFNTRFYMQVLLNASVPTAAPEGEVRQITDYVSATGTFTVTAFSANVEANDIVLILSESMVAVGRDDADNTMATTNVAANENGSILERLEQVQEAVNIGTGSALPANTSLADFVGKGTGTQLAANESLVGILYGAGITTWPAAAAPADGISIAEAIRHIVEALWGTLVNTGGTATAGGILGDVANSSVAARLTAIRDRLIGDGTDASTNAFLGKRIQKATADVLTGGSVALFTVAGGRVLVTALVGEVTAAAVGACTFKFQSNPTVGTTTDLCGTTDINAMEIGTLLGIDGVPATALLTSSSGGLRTMPNGGKGIIVPAGAIESNTGADVVGSVKFALWYFPLDNGASVAAA